MTPADAAGVFIFIMRMDAHKTRGNLKLSSWTIKNSHIAITVKEMTMTNLNSNLHVVARVFLGLFISGSGSWETGQCGRFCGVYGL